MLWLFAGAVALFAISGLVHLLVSDSGLPRRIGIELLKLGGFALALAFLMLLLTSGLTFIDFYLPAIFASPWAALLAGFVAICLFALRKVSLATYGAIEIAGATVTLAVLGFSSFGSPFQRGISLLTAAYFLIRGLENAEKGHLHHHLLSSLRSLRRPSNWRQIYILCIPLAVWLSATGPSSAIKPPFLEDRFGQRLPVSAIKCGQPFIKCDESAWRQHEQLANGTAADRAKSEAEAKARYEYYYSTVDSE